MKSASAKSGFTLIELVLVLVVAGIIASIAAAKYFDMQQSAELKTVLSTVKNVQGRVNAIFARHTLDGMPCSEAVLAVNDLSKLTDSGSGSTFGGITLALSSEGTTSAIETTGTTVWAKTTTTTEFFDTGAKLFVPQCTGESSGSADGSGSTLSPADAARAQLEAFWEILAASGGNSLVSSYKGIEFDLGNRVILTFDAESGYSSGDESYMKYTLTFTAADGTTMTMQVQEYGDAIYIREARYTSADGITTTLAHSYTSSSSLAARENVINAITTTGSTAATTIASMNIAAVLGVTNEQLYATLFNSSYSSPAYSAGSTDSAQHQLSGSGNAGTVVEIKK